MCACCLLSRFYLLFFRMLLWLWTVWWKGELLWADPHWITSPGASLLSSPGCPVPTLQVESKNGMLEFFISRQLLHNYPYIIMSPKSACWQSTITFCNQSQQLSCAWYPFCRMSVWKLEESARYPLFVHALNFPTFREFWKILCYLRVPWLWSTCALPYI